MENECTWSGTSIKHQRLFWKKTRNYWRVLRCQRVLLQKLGFQKYQELSEYSFQVSPKSACYTVGGQTAQPWMLVTLMPAFETGIHFILSNTMASSTTNINSTQFLDMPCTSTLKQHTSTTSIMATLAGEVCDEKACDMIVKNRLCEPQIHLHWKAPTPACVLKYISQLLLDTYLSPPPPALKIQPHQQTLSNMSRMWLITESHRHNKSIGRTCTAHQTTTQTACLKVALRMWKLGSLKGDCINIRVAVCFGVLDSMSYVSLQILAFRCGSIWLYGCTGNTSSTSYSKLWDWHMIGTWYVGCKPRMPVIGELTTIKFWIFICHLLNLWWYNN